MAEPKRISDINTLQPYVRDRILAVMATMRAHGFDPVVFEAKRTVERQKWLYGIGRTHHKDQRPVTWTLKSRHIAGKAADIISASRLWNWPQFYKTLKQEANKQELKVLSSEQCHIEWS